MNPNTDEITKKLEEAEEKIETAIWDAVNDGDLERELKTYTEVKEFLVGLSNLDEKLLKEKNRILAYCLMRIDNTLVGLGDSEKALERTKESLDFAEKSENIVQIARSALT